MVPVALFYIGVCIIMSLIALVMYRIDKSRAASGQTHRRIREQTLHIIDFMGGWPGGIVARRTFRHKTKDLKFRMKSWLIILIHALLIAVWCWVYISSGQSLQR